VGGADAYRPFAFATAFATSFGLTGAGLATRVVEKTGLALSSSRSTDADVAFAMMGAGATKRTTGVGFGTGLGLTSRFFGRAGGGTGLVGVVVAGARLVSGGDLHGFLRTLIMLTVIAGLTFGGRTVIDMMSANAAIVRAAAVPPANPLHAERPTR